MNDELQTLISRAVLELAKENKAWERIHMGLQRADNEWLDWWWASVNKIDIPTWIALRLKVVELRLRK